MGVYSSATRQGAYEPFDLQVARGQVDGHSVVNIYGYQASVGTTFIPVWENTTTYTYPVTALQMLVWSTSASDTNEYILVNGLDANYNQISETVILNNGTTGVLTTKSYFRINSISVAPGVGSNPVGIINIGNPAKSVQYAEIAIGAGKSQMMIYTVPANYTFYLTRATAYSNQAGGANNFVTYRVWTVDSTGIITTLLQAPFTFNYQTVRVVPRAYLQKTDIQWQCAAASQTAAVGIGVEGILIKNED